VLLRYSSHDDGLCLEKGSRSTYKQAFCNSTMIRTHKGSPSYTMHIISSILVLTASSLAAAAGNHSQAWWKGGVVYQLYPADFKESRSNDSIGWGDIKGITRKLDHIHDLGADIVWLSPFYDSPLQDMGYDISDYKSVYDIFEGVSKISRNLSRRFTAVACVASSVLSSTTQVASTNGRNQRKQQEQQPA
jgi:hypothetical protein